MCPGMPDLALLQSLKRSKSRPDRLHLEGKSPAALRDIPGPLDFQSDPGTHAFQVGKEDVAHVEGARCKILEEPPGE